mmetsp:Transcript_560/g.2186  ORF Transcript_560/g.2186 Transcript_560/m.2186 type:complete len:243 (-) Transcript_560:2390-3118(-)
MSMSPNCCCSRSSASAMTSSSTAPTRKRTWTEPSAGTSWSHVRRMASRASIASAAHLTPMTSRGGSSSSFGTVVAHGYGGGGRNSPSNVSERAPPASHHARNLSEPRSRSSRYRSHRRRPSSVSSGSETTVKYDVSAGAGRSTLRFSLSRSAHVSACGPSLSAPGIAMRVASKLSQPVAAPSSSQHMRVVAPWTATKMRWSSTHKSTSGSTRGMTEDPLRGTRNERRTSPATMPSGGRRAAM